MDESRLTWLRDSDTIKCGYKYAWYKCECGVEKEISVTNVKNNRSKSCGCLRKEKALIANAKHGMTYCPEYHVWDSMKGRCYRKNAGGYRDYGGRGIIVCEEWKNNFTKFYEDMGPRPSKEYSLDRKENDGNYCKENCRWATRGEQDRNKRNSIVLELNGVKKNMTEWSGETKIHEDTIRGRLYRGWTVEEALTTPVKRSKK